MKQKTETQPHTSSTALSLGNTGEGTGGTKQKKEHRLLSDFQGLTWKERRSVLHNVEERVASAGEESVCD